MSFCGNFSDCDSCKIQNADCACVWFCVRSGWLAAAVYFLVLSTALAGGWPEPRASCQVSVLAPCLLLAGSLLSCLCCCSALQVQGLCMSLNPPRGHWSQLPLTILALILMSLSFSGAWGIFFNLTMYFKRICVGFIQHFCVCSDRKMTLYRLSVLFFFAKGLVWN